MKFHNNEDKKLFLIEIEKFKLVESVSDSWEPTPDLIELYIQKRKDIIPKMRDFRRSQSAKKAWRHNKYNYMTGIRKFQRSTKAKRLHRTIGDFLATRESLKDKSSFHPYIFETLKALSSVKTHMYIEGEFYHPVNEYLELTDFLEELILMVSRVEKEFLESSFNISTDDLELMYRIVDPKDLQIAFAEANKVDVSVIKEHWNNFTKQSKDGESDNFFYTELVMYIESKLQNHKN